MVKKAVLKELFKKALKSLAKKVAKTAAEKAGEEMLRRVLDCVGHGAGLKRRDVVALGEESLREFQDFHRDSPEFSDINFGTVITNFKTLMKESLLPW